MGARDLSLHSATESFLYMASCLLLACRSGGSECNRPSRLDQHAYPEVIKPRLRSPIRALPVQEMTSHPVHQKSHSAQHTSGVPTQQPLVELRRAHSASGANLADVAKPTSNKYKMLICPDFFPLSKITRSSKPAPRPVTHSAVTQSPNRLVSDTDIGFYGNHGHLSGNRETEGNWDDQDVETDQLYPSTHTSNRRSRDISQEMSFNNKPSIAQEYGRHWDMGHLTLIHENESRLSNQGEFPKFYFDNFCKLSVLE